ncbi:hypothetical protein HK096_002909 [Nowakowskiella sp. JEL0078]|nr:hypothetical protein HK096_002909 [Nowakowskiella sp. JEL0078]
MRPVSVFCDFDGTITVQDTGTVLIDSSLGYENRRSLDLEILHGVKTFREAVAFMWKSYSESINISLKVGTSFRQAESERDIPLTVVSSGVKPIVQNPLLTIIANNVKIHHDHWEIIYKDER